MVEQETAPGRAKNPAKSVFRRVENDLRARLQAGHWAPGTMLPARPQLAKEYGVALATLERAVAVLIEQGLLRADSGRGTFVAQPPAPGANAPSSIGKRPSAADTLAVLVPPQNAFFRHCADQLTAQAERQGLKVVCHYNRLEAPWADVLEMEAWQAVGYLLFSYSSAPVAAALIERGRRAVVVGVPPADVTPNVPCVFGDHEHGAYLATRRLLLLGHRRIAYGHGYTADDPRQTRRWRGYAQALREAGLFLDEAAIRPDLVRAWHDDPGAPRRFFSGPDAPTALVAWTDAMAIEMVHLLRQAGLGVPSDVSVVGYDNLPFGAHGHPPLDTIDGHVEVQVRQALSMLAAPRAPETSATVMVTPTLLCRQSCARPRD